MGSLTTGLLGALVLGGLGSWIFLWIAQRERARWLGYLLITSLALKFLIVFVVSPIYYSHYAVNDSNTYDEYGMQFASALHQWQLVPLDTSFNQSIYGYLTGAVYALFGPSRYLMEVINALISTLGVLFFYKGLKLALPSTPLKLATYLIALMPSLLLWNSLHLRDPWMFLFVGLFTYGVALSVKKRTFLPLLVLGIPLIGMRLFRCYVSGVGVAASIPLLIGFEAFDRSRVWTLRLLTIAILAVGGAYLFWVAWLCTVGDQGLDPELLAGIKSSLAIGGSRLIFGHFASWGDVLLFLPQGLLDVLFRPFPWEAYNLPGLLASLENVLLFFLLILSVPQWPRLFRRDEQPLWPAWLFLIFLMSIFAIFEGNLGTLFRQKAQLMPFLLTLGALGLVPLWECLRARQRSVA